MTDAIELVEGDTLLPCPFCGGKAVRQEIDESIDATAEDENFGGSFIECDDCGACSRVFFGEKEGLVESWNRRLSGPTGSEGLLSHQDEQG